MMIQEVQPVMGVLLPPQPAFSESDTVYASVPVQPMQSLNCTDYAPNQACEILAISTRTLYKYANQLIECWYWLDESSIRANGRYTPFALKEMERLKLSKSFKQYCNAVWMAEGRSAQVPYKKTESALALRPNTEVFSGLAVVSKASDRVKVLEVEIVENDEINDKNFREFLDLSSEIATEFEASELVDDLEFQKLRQQNAQKWLKRRAILERDKQQILQGNVLPQIQK